MNAAVQSGFFGHRVLAATFVLAIFGWGVGFYGPPVFLHAVVERTQWPVALVSAAVTAHFVVGALVVANLPRLYRAWGTPRITFAGAVLSALGTCGWAWAQAPWQLFLAAAVSGAGWVGLGAAAVNALIAPWFAARRPWALAMAYNGASVGGVIFSPLWVLLIGTLGFGGAAALVGVAMVACLAVLCGGVFSRTPQQLGQSPDGLPLSEAAASAQADVHPLPPVLSWRADRRFVTLAGAMALGLFAQIGLIAHMYSLLAPALGDRLAGTAMGLATACAILGRSLAGWLVPAGADRRLAACASYALQVLGSVVLWMGAGSGDAPLLIWLGVALFGLGIGNATSLPPTIAQAEFVRADALRAVPLMVAIAQGGYAFAPAVFGALRQWQGPAAAGVLFGVAGVLQVASIACLLAGRRRLHAAMAG
ncbi:Major Facilitator Superfamily [Bordetella ansorpii]|uniref:Major Facilitator Superfamily n=1 Tax=Bordetella ansorpii TaxID=288768 RepID=A0A157PA77_9BORD|nr:MFS transporter [Bordetella ansorpii]SAI30210.1 Major Facilitator Superfamily [Bordetella ansorpii]